MKNLIEELKSNLIPKGSEPVVKLFLNNNSYYNEKFVQKCISDLVAKSLIVRSELDDFTSLEKLAIQVLFDSAYINNEEYL